MKRLAFLLGVAMSLTLNVFAQKDLLYSGGNCVSSMVCDNGNVFVWGRNHAGSNYGMLGTGDPSADKLTTMTMVPYFKNNNIQIRQVNSGSGSHFIALDCTGKVWCWGNNSAGQCGNLTSSDPEKQYQRILDHPEQVKIGNNTPTSTVKGLKGTEYDCNGYLCNVEVVYAGNNSSFAILGGTTYKGCLVSWGGNEEGFDYQKYDGVGRSTSGYDDAWGQLGCGNQNNQRNPVFVLDASKNPLKNVLQVFAGDNSAYALVDDGNGTGTIYSWGHQKSNGSLGRSATGGVGNNDDIKDPYARPVKKSDGSNLSNIVMLGCGDGVGYGLDTDGHIWSWGNSAWNNSGGIFDMDYQWYTNDNRAIPQLVRKGSTTGASNDGTYLLAKYVSGGQGFGMAITVDDLPVAWGGSSITNGGLTGNGSANNDDNKELQQPHYIQYAAGRYHDKVVLINRGDTWGFYGRADGTVWAWGNNTDGQAGFGGNETQALYAKQVDMNVDCAPHAQDPSVNLIDDFTVCASSWNGANLDAGFMMSDTRYLDVYKATWKKDGVKVQEGTIKDHKDILRVTEPGEYEVEISYIGEQRGCYVYEPAVGSVKINAYPQNFTIPELKYACGGADSLEVYVNAKSGSKAVYSWFGKNQQTAAATTVGSGKTKIKIADIPVTTKRDPVTGDTYNCKIIQVEETSETSGLFIPKNSTNSWSNGDDNLNSGSFNNLFGTGFEVKESVTITGFNAAVRSSIYNTQDGQNTGTATIGFTIFSAGTKDGGKYIINTNSRKGTLSATYNRTRTSSQQQDYDDEITATGSVTLTPGIYYITPTSYSSSGSLQNFKILRGRTPNNPTNLKDNAGGNILQFVSIASKDNPDQNSACFGYVYNIGFTTGQGFCDRISIEVPEDCNCDAPGNFRIFDKVADENADDTVYICENRPRGTLNTTKWADQAGYSYIWYKGDSEFTSAAEGIKSADIDITEAGLYKIKVYHTQNPDIQKCQREASVRVLLNPTPTVTISGGGEYCYGDNTHNGNNPIKFTMTGEPRFRVQYDYTSPSNATPENLRTDKSPKGEYTISLPYPEEVGTYTYNVTAVSDGGDCKNNNVTNQSATITVKPNPTVTITPDPNDATVCEGGSVTLTATSEPTGATFAWKKDGANNATSSEITLSQPTQSGEYSVVATLKDCKSEPATQAVVINPKPEIKTLTATDNVCSGGTITLTATVSDDGDGDFEWTGDGITGTGASVTVSNEVDTDKEFTITLNYTSANGCKAESKDIKVKFYAYPEAPRVDNPSYCRNNPANPLVGETTVANATLTWYGTSETGGTPSSTAPTPSTATPGETFYYLTQTVNGCESKTRAKSTVTVADTLAPEISATPGFEVCENAEIKLSVAGSIDTYEWYGAGAEKLNGKTLPTPTFTASSDTYVIYVKVTDSKQCTGRAKATITVNPIPEITNLSQLTNECVSDKTAQTITATVSPAGTQGTGTWTGDVTNPANMSASFIPSEAGVGTHEITYEFESDKHCIAIPKTTSVEVFKLPEISISVSNNSVCVSDNNSEVVTVSSTGTDNANGTFNYTVNNGGSINASTGAFDPKQNSPKDYTITLFYADGNGCKDTATVDLTVHPLPTVEITSANPTELCYNGSSIELVTSVDPAENGTGVWTGTESSSSNVFDPKSMNVGANPITYTFTDKYQCKKSDDYSIEVKKPAIPTPGDDVNAMINAGELTGKIAMQATLNMPADALQWMPSGDNAATVEGKSEGTVIVEGTSYESKATEVGSYHYAVRSKLMVNGEGCYSDNVIVTTNISACNAMAPKSSDVYVCVGEDLKEFSATQTSTLTNQKISWLSNNPVGKNGTEADSWILQDASTTWTPVGISTDVADEHVFYVAEYDGQEKCWSAGTKVTLHVVDNPIVTISSPEHYCAKGTDKVPVTVTPQNGVISADAGSMDGFNWLPGDYSGDNLPVEFTYTVTSDAYADGTTCKTTMTSQTTAHFMEAPTSTPVNWLIGNIDGMTDGLLKGVRLANVGEYITWYDTQTKTNKLLEQGDSFTPDKTALKAEVGSADTYVKSFWITQTDGHNCESVPSEVILNLIDCPWEAPEVTGDKKCHGIDLDPLKGKQGPSVASESSSTSLKWNWYNEQKSLITTTTAAAGSEASYPHGLSKESDGTTTFYVSYSANEKNSGNECESPMTKVTVTVLPLPEISFEKSSEIVCYTTKETEINVTATSANGAGSGKWSVTGDASAISASGIFYAQANGELEGQKQYTIRYVYTDAENCVDSLDRTIDVIYLPAPTTTGFYAMTTQSNPVTVKAASMTTGAEAKWFDVETMVNNVKGSGTSWATGDATSQVVDKNYYVRQYMEGCYSEPTVANVKIVPCPIPSVLIEDEEACNYEEVPTLRASTGDWSERDASSSSFKFYNESGTVLKTVANGEYQPTITNEGNYTYNVAEYNSNPLQNLTVSEGCEGPKKIVTITIKGTGSPEIKAAISPAEVCEGETNPTFIATNVVGTIGWYEEDPQPDKLGVPVSSRMGEQSTFVPNGEDAGKYTVWAVQFAGGCYGPKVSKEYTINPIPEAPKTEGVSICYGEGNKPVTATSQDNGEIYWYADAEKITTLASQTSGYLSKETLPGDYTYYASQKVNGCESKTNSVVYRIKSLPSVPVIIPQKNLCEYEDAPVLEASGENITWYSSSDKSEVIGNGETLQTTDMTPGTKRYYASQTVEECEGDVVLLSYTVNSKPVNPNVKGTSVCEGNELIPSLSTNMPSDKWYADEFAVTYLTSGYNFTPDASEVGNTDKTYYVQREMNGCVSDIMPVVLHVIPKPEIVISSDTTLCIYDEVVPIQVYKVSPAFNEDSYVEWQVKTGKKVNYFDDEEDHQIVPSDVITAEGDYKVLAMYKYGYEGVYCISDTASMTYTVKGRARKPIVFSSVICQGDDIKDLQALGSPNMKWGSLDGAKPFAATGTRYHFDPGQVLDTGTYSFVIYDENIYDVENNLGCKSEYDTVYMTVAPAAKTKLFGRDSVCVGLTEQYYTQFTKESTYFWNVTGDHLNYSKDAMSSSVRYVDWMKSGIDTLTVYEQTWAGCEGWDTLVVKIAAMPKALYTWEMPGASNLIELTDSTIQDTLWYTNEEGELQADPVSYTLFWNYGHIGEDENAIDTVVAYEKKNFPLLEGNYIYGYNCPILTVENSFGCKDVYKECIFVNITSSIYVPTAFAPMNPAHSVRTFQPKGYNLKTCEISVFDKWGNLLWHSDAVEDGKFVGSWDGRYDGKMMKSDVYIWKMEATFLDGQEWQGFDVGHGKKAKFGSVTLVR